MSLPAAAGVIVWLPLVAKVPLQLPDAVQLVLLTELQVSVVDPPTVTELAPKVSVGAAGATWAVTVRVTDVTVDEPVGLEHNNE